MQRQTSFTRAEFDIKFAADKRFEVREEHLFSGVPYTTHTWLKNDSTTFAGMAKPNG